MNLLFKLFAVLTFLGSCTQVFKYSTIHCEESYRVMYRSSETKQVIDNYFIGFGEGFNDTLEVFHNGDLIHKEYFLTDPSLGSAGSKVTFKKGKRISSNIILVRNTMRKNCLEFSFDTRYKIAYINLYEGKWVVTYTNEFIIYE